MTYQLKTFSPLSGENGTGNTVADRINQWLAFNPGVTPMEASALWPEGVSRASGWLLTLLYRKNGQSTRFWSSVFTNSPGMSAESKMNTFLANNPTLFPTITIVIERPGAGAITRSILVIYAVGNWAQIASGPRVMIGAPRVNVGVATYGAFADPGDRLRPEAAALNLGNVIWPAGAAGILFSTSSNNPDQDELAGVSPCCSGGPPPAVPPTITVMTLCGKCLPSRIS